MTEVVGWYLALTLVGAGGLLPSAMLFTNLWSGGVLFARPLALLLLGVGLWLTTFLTPLPYGQGLVVGAVVALWLGSAILAARQPHLLRAIWDRRRVLIAGEMLFAALFVLLAVSRAQTPAAFGNEKPMEMLLLTAMHHASSMPPPDPWFAGESVAYYYLGYLMVDLVARLAGLVPAQAFNLGLATAGALAGAGVLALAGDLASLSHPRQAGTAWIAGAVAVVSLLFLAPIQGFLDLLWMSGVGSEGLWSSLGVEGFPGPRVTVGMEPKPEWWWWHATRTIPDTIVEFPAFSLLLGDLHPHVLALPFGIVALALAASSTLGTSEPSGLRYWKAQRFALLTGGLIFAGLYMTNAWDVLSYGMLWFGAALIGGLRSGRRIVQVVLAAALHVLLPATIALLLAAPFILGSSAPMAGLGLVVRASDPVRFGLIWVPLVLPLVAAAALLRPPPARPVLVTGLVVGGLAVLSWIMAAFLGGHSDALDERAAGWLVLAALIGAGSWAAGGAVRAQQAGDPSTAAWLGLLTASSAVVLLTELTYLAEEFHFDHRANTVFKLWYVIWMLLAVAGGVAVGHAVPRLLRWRPLALDVGLACCLALYLVSLLYAPFVLDSRVREAQEPSVNALAFHEALAPELAAAMDWAHEHLGEDDLLLESVGSSHTYSNVISTTTAIPTLLGWLHHELIWRGRIPEISQRWAIVDAIYLGGATDDVRAVAQRYGVTHIYLGNHEFDRYGAELSERFAGWPTVFEAGDTRIVRVPRPLQHAGGQAEQ